MKTQITIPILLFLIVLAGATGYAQGINFLHDEPFDKVLMLAKQQNKKIFVDGYIQACAPCKQLDKEVFPTKEAGDYFNSNYVCVKYDIEQPEGKKVKALYPDVITGYPSLLVIDNDGKMIHKMGGFHPADSLIAKMQAAWKGRSLSAMRARLASGEQSLAFLKTYKQIIKEGYLNHPGGEDDRINKVLLSRLSDNELTNPEVWKMIGNSLTDINSPAFERAIRLLPKFQEQGCDIQKIKFQLSNVLRQGIDALTNPKESEKISLPPMPKDTTLISGYLKNPDFKNLEQSKIKLSVFNYAHLGYWKLMLEELNALAETKSLVPGQNHQFIYQYIQYMIQHQKDKRNVAEALRLVEYLQGQKNKTAYNDDYNTIITLQALAGNKKAVAKYKKLQQSQQF